MKENKLISLIQEAIHTVLNEMEENPNASDSEWIKWAVRICVLNNRDIYDKYDALGRAVEKKINKGTVDVDILANSRTMKDIIRMAFRANDIVPRLHKEEFMECCQMMAQEMIDDLIKWQQQSQNYGPSSKII